MQHIILLKEESNYNPISERVFNWILAMFEAKSIDIECIKHLRDKFLTDDPYTLRKRMIMDIHGHCQKIVPQIFERRSIIRKSIVFCISSILRQNYQAKLLVPEALDQSRQCYFTPFPCDQEVVNFHNFLNSTGKSKSLLRHPCTSMSLKDILSVKSHRLICYMSVAQLAEACKEPKTV